MPTDDPQDATNDPEAAYKTNKNQATETQGTSNQPTTPPRIKVYSYSVGVAGDFAAGVFNPPRPLWPQSARDNLASCWPQLYWYEEV